MLDGASIWKKPRPVQLNQPVRRPENATVGAALKRTAKKILNIWPHLLFSFGEGDPRDELTMD
jgi:hypothetical protein